MIALEESELSAALRFRHGSRRIAGDEQAGNTVRHLFDDERRIDAIRVSECRPEGQNRNS